MFGLEGMALPAPIPSHLELTEAGTEDRQPDEEHRVDQGPQLEDRRDNEQEYRYPCENVKSILQRRFRDRIRIAF